MTENTLTEIAIHALEDVKGIDIVHLDVTEMTDVADHLVIATGSSSRQVKALANNVIEEAKKAGHTVHGTEGDDVSDWVLIDLVDVVVHVMTPESREFYDLERLWSVTSNARRDRDE